jgi:hypothetical protein
VSTSRLKIYNEALMICGERGLAALTEDREPRHLLDQVWDNDGVKRCLESGQWRFAMRAVRLDYDTAIDPEFGYRRAFEKPSDWCATTAVCQDEYYNAPLTQYIEEAGYWFCDLDELYVRYVSNDAEFGGDLSLWPARFAYFVAADFASRIILKLTSDEKKRDGILHPRNGIRARALKEAKSHDAMAGPTTFPPRGSWSSARGAGSGRRDRGSRSNLTG